MNQVAAKVTNHFQASKSPRNVGNKSLAITNDVTSAVISKKTSTTANSQRRSDARKVIEVFDARILSASYTRSV